MSGAPGCSPVSTPLIRHWSHVYMGVVTHAHPIRGESHFQRNPDREVATSPQTSLQATSN